MSARVDKGSRKGRAQRTPARGVSPGYNKVTAAAAATHRVVASAAVVVNARQAPLGAGAALHQLQGLAKHTSDPRKTSEKEV